MKFKGRSRIDSARIHSWDYASPGGYFVTKCTSQVKLFFGKIDEGFPVLNK